MNQEELKKLAQNSPKPSKQVMDHVNETKKMVEEALGRGVPVRWLSEEAIQELYAFHTEEALFELRKVYQQQIDIFDLVQAGTPFEEATKKVLNIND